jgi:phenylalanyl-tRNA synthetase alpha chain
MAKESNPELKKIIESLSPNERKIIPFLKEKTLKRINEKTNIDQTAILRALEFLSNKQIIELKVKTEKIVGLELNGTQYVRQGLPERRLINLIAEKKSVSLPEAQKLSRLNPNEFKAALGALKKKALINLINGNILLSGNKKEIAKKTLEEIFLESLPKKLEELEPEEKFALENLKSRKEMISIKDKKVTEIHLTPLGEELIKAKISSKELIESLTPNIIKTGSWKNKKFRRYDITSPTPKINGGKRHFVNQATDYAKKIWLEMGFKEMTGSLAQSGFWNFDALFTAQDHPVREMQDTFFIKNKTSKLLDKRILQAVKDAHEGNIKGSKSWQ